MRKVQYFQKLQRLCDATEMQAMDQNAIQKIGIPSIVLMENAAHSVAAWLDQNHLQANRQAKIVVCCGQGNNGGDGFAIARLLKNRHHEVTVIEAGAIKTEDAQLNQTLWQQFGKSVLWGSKRSMAILDQADFIVDAIFGTGLERAVEGLYKDWIERINQNRNAVKIGVDIPSGIHADNGQVMGIALECQHTMAFQVGKQGCYQYPGARFAGKMAIADISIPPHWSSQAKPTYLLTEDFVQANLPMRTADSHKGSYGHLFTICGSAGMGGAAQLASFAALKNGSGLVSACVPRILQDGFLGISPEVMTLSSQKGSPHYFMVSHLPFVESEVKKRDAVVLGCGIGQMPSTKKFVQQLVSSISQPLLIDADGLNCINSQLLMKRSASTVITPHPRELSRLCGLTPTEIQKNRIAVCRKFAQQWQVVLLLKGAYTVIGDPEGRIFINPTGNEGMATAGAGDVLSGIIGSFLSQNCSPLQATLLGAYLHGLAGDCLKATLSASYMSASDLMQGLNQARRMLERLD